MSDPGAQWAKVDMAPVPTIRTWTSRGKGGSWPNEAWLPWDCVHPNFEVSTDRPSLWPQHHPELAST